MARMSKAIVWSVFLVLLCAGCIDNADFPGLKSKTDSELKLGLRRGVRLGPDMEGRILGFASTDSSGRTTKFDELMIEQKPSVTMAQGWVPAIDASVGQINAKWAGRNENARIWSPVVSNFIDKGFGVLGQAVTGHYSVAEQKLMSKQIVAQGVAAMLTGDIDRGPLMQNLTSDIGQQIDAKLEQVKASFSAELIAEHALALAAKDKEIADLKAKLAELQTQDTQPAQ